MTPFLMKKNIKNIENDMNVIVDNSVEMGDFFCVYELKHKKIECFSVHFCK